MGVLKMGVKVPSSSSLLVNRMPVEIRSSVKMVTEQGLRRNVANVDLELRGRSLVHTAGGFSGVLDLDDAVVERGRKRDLKVKEITSEQVTRFQFETEEERDKWYKRLSAPSDKVSLADFEVLVPVGRGGMGSVFLVRKRDTGEKFAMKVLPRHSVDESNKAMRRALDERLILEMVVGYPFIIQLKYAFQTEKNLYMVTDFASGGDLHDYLQGHDFSLKEEVVRSFMAEIVLAIEHIHSLGAVYRDVKPENILIDASGHIRLADLGLAKFVDADTNGRTYSFCGTTKFMAPEVYQRRGHGKAADLWSLGALLYTLLTGSTPYSDPTLLELDTLNYPSRVSAEARDLVRKLLQPEVDRLDMDGLKAHSWFSTVDFADVFSKATVPNTDLWEEWERMLLTTGKFLHTKAARIQDLSLGEDTDNFSNHGTSRKAPTPLRRLFKRGSQVNLIPGYLFASSSIRSSGTSKSSHSL